MFLAFVFDLLSVAVMFLLPAYGTVREALDGRKRMGDWLQYWAVVGLCMWAARLPLGIVGIVTWLVPFADTFKILFFVWLWHERFEGAKILFDYTLPYYKAARPAAQRFVALVEAMLQMFERLINSQLKKGA